MYKYIYLTINKKIRRKYTIIINHTIVDTNDNKYIVITLLYWITLLTFSVNK